MLFLRLFSRPADVDNAANIQRSIDTNLSATYYTVNKEDNRQFIKTHWIVNKSINSWNARYNLY